MSITEEELKIRSHLEKLITRTLWIIPQQSAIKEKVKFGDGGVGRIATDLFTFYYEPFFSL